MNEKKVPSYSEKTLNEALAAVKQGVSFSQASKSFKVPLSTLHLKFHKGDFQLHKKGPAPALLTNEEQQLVEWVKLCSARGYP